MSPQQIGALINGIPDPERPGKRLAGVPDRYTAMVLLTAASGVRQAEAFGVTTSRVSFLKRELRIDRQVVSGSKRPAALVDRTKTPASVRTIPLPQEAIDALAAHLAKYPQSDPDAPIFTNPHDGPLSRSSFFNDVWRSACGAAGLPEISLTSG